MKEIKTKVILIAFIVIILGGLFYFSDFSVENKINNLTTNNKGLSPKVLKNKAEKIVNEFFVQPGKEIKITKATRDGDLYKLDVVAEGQQPQPLYITKDGKKLIPQVIDIEELQKAKKEAETQAAKEAAAILKTDKPKVELFVMSYCPYGTQFEKGYLPVVDKLKGKIDAEIKFVNYVMHQKKESDENVRQYCIGQTQPEKSNQYLSCFLEKGDVDGCIARNKINTQTLNKCITDTDKKFAVTKNMNDKSSWLNGKYPKFMIDDNLNKQYGVQGSPTLVVNGKIVQPAGRDSNSILKTICSAFKTPPAECKENISSESPTPGFGYEKTSDTQVAASCGA